MDRSPFFVYSATSLSLHTSCNIIPHNVVSFYHQVLVIWNLPGQAFSKWETVLSLFCEERKLDICWHIFPKYFCAPHKVTRPSGAQYPHRWNKQIQWYLNFFFQFHTSITLLPILIQNIFYKLKLLLLLASFITRKNKYSLLICIYLYNWSLFSFKQEWFFVKKKCCFFFLSEASLFWLCHIYLLMWKVKPLLKVILKLESPLRHIISLFIISFSQQNWFFDLHAWFRFYISYVFESDNFDYISSMVYMFFTHTF